MAHEVEDTAGRKGEVKFKNGRAYRTDPDAKEEEDDDPEDRTVKDADDDHE